MELTWGTAEREAKDRHSWRKRNGCIIHNEQNQQKKKKLIKIFAKQLCYIQNISNKAYLKNINTFIENI